jgi:hypothetical protein
MNGRKALSIGKRLFLQAGSYQGFQTKALVKTFRQRATGKGAKGGPQGG